MRLFDLVENENKNLVVIYPGRFHPFHIGHGKVFQYLKKNYKGAQVFIASSGKTDAHKSPFMFDEKKKMMMLAGVDPNAIVQTKVPYVATEITDRFDPDTTVVVYAVSEKDMAEDPRFDFPQVGLKMKKNGDPAHVQKWPGIGNAKPLREHSYIVTVPTFTFKIRGEAVNSATQIRNMIAKADETELTQILQDLYGRRDIPNDIITIFQRKLQSNVMSENWEETSLYESLFEAELYFEILNERKLTGGEKRSKESHFKKLKKHKSDFVDRYGDEAESIMHAVATKRAKKESRMKISDIIISEKQDWDFSKIKNETTNTIGKSTINKSTRDELNKMVGMSGKASKDNEDGIDPLKVAGAAAAVGIPASMIGRKIGKDVVRDIKGDGPEDRRARERFKKDQEKKAKRTPKFNKNANTSTKPSSVPGKRLPGVTRSGGAGMIINPKRTIGGGGRIEPKLRNNPLNMFNEEDGPLNEWQDAWNTLRNSIPDINKFMADHGYNANSTASIKRFIQNNPKYIDINGKALAKGANLPDFLFKSIASKKVGDAGADALIKAREMLKSQHPEAWKQFTQGNPQAALKALGLSEAVTEAILEHIERGVPFRECIFRPGSKSFREFYRGLRNLNSVGLLEMDWEDEELLETDIGELIKIEGEIVPLDVPFLMEEELDEAEYNGKQVKLNSPKRGGPKKFYVYVKNPKTGRVKKVSWGDKGLSVKAKNPGAVKSFVARHKCKQKNDKTKAGYWACRTPRYKSLGVKGGTWW